VQPDSNEVERGKPSSAGALRRLCESLWRLRCLKNENPGTTAYQRTSRENLLCGDTATAWTNIEEVSPFVTWAVVAAEDKAFYGHRGISMPGIRRAIRERVKRGYIVSGGSTITQQLARNLYLDSKVSIHRKVSEMLLAMAIECILSKDRILEIYLNICEWGPGIWGIRAASHNFANKQPGDLSMVEAIYLASLLAAPKAELSGRNYRRMCIKQHEIIRHLRLTERVSDEEFVELTHTICDLQKALRKNPERMRRRGRS